MAKDNGRKNSPKNLVKRAKGKRSPSNLPDRVKSLVGPVTDFAQAIDALCSDLLKIRQQAETAMQPLVDTIESIRLAAETQTKELARTMEALFQHVRNQVPEKFKDPDGEINWLRYETFAIRRLGLSREEFWSMSPAQARTWYEDYYDEKAEEDYALKSLVKAALVEFLGIAPTRINRGKRDAVRVASKPYNSGVRNRQERLDDLDLEPESYSQANLDDLTQQQTTEPVAKGQLWSDVEIRFISEETAEISVGSNRKIKSFTEMGFEDRRGKPGPVQAWKTLQLFAAKKGELDRCDFSVEDWPQIKTRVANINRKLKRVFNVAERENPIKYDVRANRYVTRFRITHTHPQNLA